MFENGKNWDYHENVSRIRPIRSNQKRKYNFLQRETFFSLSFAGLTFSMWRKIDWRYGVGNIIERIGRERQLVQVVKTESDEDRWETSQKKELPEENILAVRFSG